MCKMFVHETSYDEWVGNSYACKKTGTRAGSSGNENPEIFFGATRWGNYKTNSRMRQLQDKLRASRPRCWVMSKEDKRTIG